MLHVGYKNYVSVSKVLAITGVDSSPLRRQRKNAEDNYKIIDCTQGRKTLSLVHLTDGVILASAITPEGLHGRLSKENKITGQR